MTNNTKLITQLEQLRSKTVDEINNRILYWRTYDKELRSAKADNRKLTIEGMICPTPYVVPETGNLEWRYHILTYEKDLKAQVKYLRNFADELDHRIESMTANQDDIFYSEETMNATAEYYKNRAEEMSVVLDEDIDGEENEDEIMSVGSPPTI